MKSIRKNTLSIVVAVFSLVLALFTVAYAAGIVLFSFRVDGTIDGNTDTIRNDGLIDMEITETTLSFAQSGEASRKNLTLAVKNNSSTNITYSFGLTAETDSSSSLSDEEFTTLTSAVLVYLDGTFEGTLSSLIQNGEKIFDNGYVMAKGDAAHTQTHTLTFELHIATESALLNKAFGVRVATYTRNANYINTILVSNENEFIQAAGDINSGLIDLAEGETPTIALAEDITLATAATLKYATNIDLCGHMLVLNENLTLTGSGTYTLYSSLPATYDKLNGTGAIIVNNANALLEIKDFYAKSDLTKNIGKLYSEKTTLTAYDAKAAETLLVAHVKDALKYGVESGESVDVCGALYCYAENAEISAVANCTYSGGLVSVKAADVGGTRTQIASITVGTAAGAGATTIEFQAIGGEEGAVFASILANELKHIPNTTDGDAIVYDLFLPKYIQSKNATIEWTSADESSINSDGKLAETLKENTTVTLYAKITINNQVYTHSFTFKVTSQTRETKFKYLVAQLSPVKLTAVYKADSGNKPQAWYYLPTVGTSGEGYDYRGDFDMIYDDEGTAISVWSAFKDIGLQNLTYKVKSGYNFISLGEETNGGIAVYLNSATFYTFAQLTVTGDFGDGETYEDSVNVIIELGSNSELYELAFSFVEQTLNGIDILQNIIDTRVTYGMKYESGDFYLATEYQGIQIEYSPATENSGIKKVALEEVQENGETVEKYHIYVDPTKFSSSEGSVGLKVKVIKEGDSTGQSRILYLSTPAVIKPDDSGFANYSVFNSVKYQTTLSITDTADSDTADRVAKLPAITGEGDTKPTGFTLTNGVLTNGTPDYILARDAKNVSTLTFRVGDGGSSASEAHTKAYNFSLLLKWATGSEIAEIPFSFGSYSKSDTTDYSDGKEYLDEKEAEILQAYLSGEVGFTSDEVTSLWSKTTETKNGHIIKDYSEISALAASYATGTDDYFKYTEVLQWALNEKDFPNAGGKNAKSPPNLGVIGKYNIDMSGSSTTNLTSTTLDWTSDPSNWDSSSALSDGVSKYWNTPYLEDDTEYISDYEAQCIMAFWYGLRGSTNGTTFAKAFLAACVQPTYVVGDGAGVLINSIYEKLLGTYNADSSAESTIKNFTVEMSDGVPVISVLGYSTTAITDFTSLTSIEVYGALEANADGDYDVKLPAFLTTNSVNGFFNRLTSFDEDKEAHFTEFVMQACSADYTEFDLSTISRLTKVTYFDFSYNTGITTVGELLNTNIDIITYLDVHQVNVTGEYLTYVLDNIKVIAPSSDIYYTQPASGTTNAQRALYQTEADKISDELRFLKNLTKISSEYLIVATKANAGNGDKVVQWYVEEGNPAYLVSDAGGDSITQTISTAAGMNALLKNYYIATADISCVYDSTTYNLQKNHVYQIKYGNGFIFEDLGITAEPTNSMPDGADIDWDAISSTYNDEGRETLTEQTPTFTAPSYSGTWSTIQSNAQNNGATTSTISTSTSRTYTYFYTNSSSSYSARVYVYGLYQVSQTMQSEGSTYRYYFNTYKQYDTNSYYYSSNSVLHSIFKKGTTRYLDYTVTASRTYDLYYARISSSSYASLTQILSDTLSYSGWGDSTTVDTSSYTYFRYGSTSGTLYQYRTSGGEAYYEESYSTTIGGTTYTATTLSALQTQVEAAIKALDEDSTLFTTKDFSSSSSMVYNYVSALGSSIDVQSAIAGATAVKDGFYLYQYTGATGSDDIYIGGTATSNTYTRNGGYLLKFGTGGTTGDGYYFEEYAIQTASSSVNMEAILSEANTHTKDAEFGNYYGNYYCYNGSTSSVNGHSYVNTYVYRLLFDGTSFYFEHDNLPDVKKMFTTISSGTALMSALTTALSGGSGALQEGSIVYYSATEYYYGSGMFVLTYNTETYVYYFKSMGGVGNIDFSDKSFTTSSITGQNLSNTGISKFKNIRYLGLSSNNYSGTGGSEEVIIVARVIGDDGTIYERKFKVTVSA